MRSFLLTMAMCLLGIMPTFSSIKDGEAVLTAGSTTRISIGATYKTTLSRATKITYKWSTSNASLLGILSNNKNECTIKGLSAGSAKLYFYCSYFYDGYYRTMDFYYDITVRAATVSVNSITLNETRVELSTGETFQLTATIYPTNATNKNVNWTTSIASVATVNSEGLVTAKGEGTATITCYAADGSGCRRTCEILVNKDMSAIEDVDDETRNSGFISMGNSIIFNKPERIKVTDLNGRVEYNGITQCVENLPNGIHIVKWNGKSRKIVMK